MVKRKIQKVIEFRGFGFIRADDGREIFFHMSGLQDIELKDLKEGDMVEFDVEEGPHGRGPRAVGVRRASDLEEIYSCLDQNIISKIKMRKQALGCKMLY